MGILANWPEFATILSSPIFSISDGDSRELARVRDELREFAARISNVDPAMVPSHVDPAIG
jgi:hypothetical protein